MPLNTYMKQWKVIHTTQIIACPYYVKVITFSRDGYLQNESISNPINIYRARIIG